MEDPGSYTFNLDLCCFGMVSLDGKERLRKTIRLTTTSIAFEKILKKQCDAGHEHRRIQGAETGATAHYPWRFARGVLKAYLKTTATPGEHTAFAVAKTGGGPPKDEPGLDETELVPDEEWQGSRGITFSEQIPAKWAAICKKLHQNLGHPPNVELARQLKYSDADEHLIRAAKCLKCQTCSRCTKPGTRRPARPATLMDFGEALAMDVIHFGDSAGNKVKALSMVDMWCALCRAQLRRTSRRHTTCIGPPGRVTHGSSLSIWTAGSKTSSSAWWATLARGASRPRRIGKEDWWSGATQVGKPSGRRPASTR